MNERWRCNIDELTKIINAYQANRVSFGKLKSKLSWLVHKENNAYIDNTVKVLERSRVPGNTKSAEDEFFERRGQERVEDVLEMMMEYIVLTEDELSILSDWVLNDKTQAAIAEERGVTQQAIAKTIASIREKARNFIASTTEPNELIAAIAYRAATTTPRSARKDAHAAKHKIRWPSEYFQNVSRIGQWYKGKYKTKTVCVVPEFLSEAFGDNDTKCTKCFDEYGGSTCTRKDVNQ